MKKIYLVVASVAYEGEETLAAFEDKLDAHEWLLNDRPDGYDWYEVESMELREKTAN